MFESLSDKIQGIFKKLRNSGKLTEENISEALREVRRALLEADVSLAVVKTFMAEVKEKALGQDVLQGLNPGQQLVKIVHDGLVELLGGERAPLKFAPFPPTIVLMAGLQGSGKTTTSGKLALHLRKLGRRPLLVACDVYRPAAIKQLQVLGKQIDVPVYADEATQDVLQIARGALAQAKDDGRDTVIVDTAGRLHVDEAMMAELVALQQDLQPTETLLVVDAMTGQDAVNMAEAFHREVPLTGVVLTKLDGDTRGGAALSVKHVTGCPIKFAATGEKLDALEPFHPDRIATRILGMGDVLTLIEKAQEAITEDEARELERKMRKAEFNLEDFAKQLQQMKKIGSLGQIIGMIPGLGGALSPEHLTQGEAELKKTETLINSMTVAERRHPDLLAKNPNRKARVARGSGMTVQDVNRLLKQFEQMRKVMKQFAGMSKAMSQGKMPRMPGGMPGGRFPFPR